MNINIIATVMTIIITLILIWVIYMFAPNAIKNHFRLVELEKRIERLEENQ